MFLPLDLQNVEPKALAMASWYQLFCARYGVTMAISCGLNISFSTSSLISWIVWETLWELDRPYKMAVPKRQSAATSEATRMQSVQRKRPHGKRLRKTDMPQPWRNRTVHDPPWLVWTVRLKKRLWHLGWIFGFTHQVRYQFLLWQSVWHCPETAGRHHPSERLDVSTE